MKWAIFDSLPAADEQKVMGLARRRRFTKGTPIFHEGDPGDTIHLIASGHVAVRVTTPLGDVATLRILGPGSHFGDLAIAVPGPRNATVVAIGPVETLSLHRDHLDELRSRNPAVDAALTGALVAEVRRLSSQLRDAYYLPAPKRLAGRLVDLAEMFGPPDGLEGEIVIPLTQEELAQIVGTTRRTANQLLQDLQEREVVSIERGRMTIVPM